MIVLFGGAGNILPNPMRVNRRRVVQRQDRLRDDVETREGATNERGKAMYRRGLSLRHGGEVALEAEAINQARWPMSMAYEA